jgi:predicted RNA-binding Zn-ribbon protein involved in translation (DUF1610 family)
MDQRKNKNGGTAGMMWLHKVRLRVLALVVATALAAIGAVSLAALPVWPVVVGAVATVALMVNTMTAKLNQPVCWGCGKSIANQPAGEYGVICPQCGALSQVSKPKR